MKKISSRVVVEFLSRISYEVSVLSGYEYLEWKGDLGNGKGE